jgi:hypothetical protein
MAKPNPNSKASLLALKGAILGILAIGVSLKRDT